MLDRKFLSQITVVAGFAIFVLFPITVTGTDSVESQIQRHIVRVGRVNEPGVAVLVRKNDKTVIQLAQGVRDLRSQAKIDATTNFRLASSTKQFTAMAIMLLVNDGKLRYDERLTQVFPEFPEYGHSITIRSLLNHTSGLPDYEELMDKASAGKQPLWTAFRQITDAEVLKLLETEKTARFVPGKHWAYSNSGYVMLGLIVAKTSGQSFPEFLHDRIFKPLSMNHTVAYVRGVNEVESRAYGHSLENGAIVETDQSPTSATLGDGGIYSSLEDLAKWDDALAHHQLLSETEMQAALMPMKMPDGSLPHWDSGPGDSDPLAGKPISYGFGWFLDPYKGHLRVWHYGETMGFKSSIQRFPKEKLSVIVLSNRSDVDAIKLSAQIVDLFLK